MDCTLCEEFAYDTGCCYSCFKLLCHECYDKLDRCPYCRTSYSEYNALDKITILLNLIETESPKIDIDIALYTLCCFKSIKNHEELRIFYLERCKYPSAYNDLGCIYWERKEEEKAIDYFKKGTEKKHPMCMLNLAEEYFKMRDDEKAKELLIGIDEKFLSNDGMSDKNFYLGIIYYRENNYKDAKLYLEASDDEDERKFIYLNKIYHSEGNYELAMYNIKLTKDQKLIDEYMSYDKLKRLYDNCGCESNSKKIKLINDILEGE
jgi:hypothetical protein